MARHQPRTSSNLAFDTQRATESRQLPTKPLLSAAGFTIVELLIVIVVIAILAAITIVSYNGITNQAYDATVQNDLRQIAQKVKLFKVENGHLPTTVELNSLNIRLGNKQAYAMRPTTDHNVMYCAQASTERFAIVSWSASGHLYAITQDGGVAPYSGNVIVGDDWQTNPAHHACKVLIPGWEVGTSGDYNMRGYAPDDTTDGPWRAWVGGNDS